MYSFVVEREEPMEKRAMSFFSLGPILIWGKMTEKKRKERNLFCIVWFDRKLREKKVGGK